MTEAPPEAAKAVCQSPQHIDLSWRSSTLTPRPLLGLALTLAILAFSTCLASAQVNRLSNPDFESGSAGWTLGSQWFIYSLNNQGHNNSARYAYFGVGSDGTTPVLNGNSTIYQSVSIPSSATSASLNFWMRITTSEVLTTAFDYLYVEVRNSSGSVLSTVATYSNRTASATGWNNYVLSLPSSYAGQTIQIAFHGTTDSNTVTVFRIDDVSLTVSVPPPSVVTTAASSITSSSAQSNGTVNPNGTLTNAYFDYGTTTAYGQTTSSTSVGSGSSPVGVNGLLAGLSANTTYHYRLVATNTNGQTTYGSDASFTTSAPSLPNLTPYQAGGWSDKLVISRSTGTSTDSSGLTTADNLYLDWAVINNGTASTSVVFYTQLYLDGVLVMTWNTQPPLPVSNYAYVLDYPLGKLSAGQHSVELIVDTTNSITESNESSADNSYTKFFTVSDVPLPAVTTNAATNVTSTSATINGAITADGGYGITDRRFDWGTSTPLSQAIYSTDITVSGSSFSASLTGLQPNTTYYFRAWAQNTSNLNSGVGVGWGRGSIMSFTTPQLPAPVVNRIVSTLSTSVDDIVPAVDGQQTIDVYGTSFSYGGSFKVRVLWTGDFKDLPAAQVVQDSATHFRILINTTSTEDSWAIIVTNSTGQVSQPYYFSALPYPDNFTLLSAQYSEPSGQQQVQLNWSGSTYADSYEVYRDNTLIQSGLSTYSRNLTIIDAFTRGQTYAFKMKARNAVGSIFSNTLSVTIPAATVPILAINSPSNGSSYTVGSSIPISWSLTGATSGVTGIRLSILNNNSQVFVIPLSKTTTSYSWTAPSTPLLTAGAIKLETVGAVATPQQVAITTTQVVQNSPAPYPIITMSEQSPVSLNKAIQFSGANSQGNVTAYYWYFSDGSSTTGATVSHSFTTSQTGKGWVKLILNSPSSGYEASVAFALKGAGNNPQQGTSLDPVNSATGAFLAGLDLMPVGGRGLPFLFQAYYNSMSYQPAGGGLSETPPGSLGYSWTHTFETHVEVTTPEDGVRVALVVFGDGHAEKYTLAAGSTNWQPEPGVFSQLTEGIDGRFSLLTHSRLRHDFDVGGRLDAITDQNGNALDIVWEDVPGGSGARRIQKVVLPGGPDDGSVTHAVLFSYRSTSPTFLWKLEDPMHHFIEFTQDAAGDLVAWNNERTHATSYTYDVLHQLLTGTDAKTQRFVRNYYNADRRVEKQEDPGLNVTLFSYNFPADLVSNRVTTITRLADPSIAASDARNEITEDVHDPKLRRLEHRVKVQDQTQAGQFVWLSEKWAYDQTTSEVISRRNRRNLETKLSWQNGNLSRVETPDGGVRTLEYTDPLNPALPTLITYPDIQVKEKREYDERGNLTAVIFPYDAAQPNQHKRTFTVDARGQIKMKTDANGVQQSSDFDVWGNLNLFVDGEGKSSNFESDANGRKTASIDALSHRTDSLFNEIGNLYKIQRADPNDPVNPLVTEVTYDENEQAILASDPLAHLSYSHRDVHGRVWKDEDHEHNLITHRFDAFGREVETENAKGGKVIRSYNFAGYLMSEASPAPSTNIINYLRDENGNVTQTVDGDSVRRTFEYDTMDRAVVTKRWKSATEFDQTRSSYNLLGQKEWDENENGQKTYYFYDLAGNHIRTVPPAGPEFTFGYDNEGHQTSATHDGNRTSHIEYNGRYQVKKRIDENNHVEEFVRDDVGNLWKHIQEADDGTSLITVFEYDSLNRLIKITPPTGPPITFKFDKANRRVEMTDATGTTKWTYSTLNQVGSIELPTGLKLAFHYDSLGATDSITYPGTRIANYVTDAAGRFQSVTDWAGRTISQTYTAGDRPLKLQFPNGIHSDFGHDAEGRVNAITHQRGTETPLLQLPYDFDARGLLKTMPDVQLTEPESSYPRTYGNANELLTIAGSPVTHDNRGNVKTAKLNPVSPATDTLTWDYGNRLASGSIGGAAFSNTFNGLGYRVSTTRSGVTTGFLMDDRGSMPRIMAETDAAGTPTAFYLYVGNVLLARISTDNSALWYATDRQGNVVLLTDGSGSTAAIYQYDPFGVPASSSGSFASINRFRYLGGLGVWDNDDGTLHARARSYHPRLGRFLSRDALYGNNLSAQSLNRYVYALNDPFGFGDPSGFKPVRPLIFAPPPEFSFWQAFGEDLATRAGYIGAGFIPGVGEAMDLETLSDPNAAGWQKGLATISLGLSIGSDGFTPNFGGFRRAFSYEARVVVRETEPVVTRFVSGVRVVDKNTGKIIEGTVDLDPTLGRINEGGGFPHRNDGGVFQNRPVPGSNVPELPVKPDGYYREYVHPTPGIEGAGPQRIVTGQGGELYYTPDHYQTFIPLN